MTVELLKNMILARTITNCKLREIEQLQALRTNITSCLKEDVVQTSGAGDKLGDLTAAILDLEAELERAIEQAIENRKEFEKIISKVTNPQEYEVMHRRYVLFQSFGQIAKEMHFSKTAIYKIHERVLEKVNDCPQSERGDAI